ncbi:multidrug effflux MFS transporter [Pseudomonas viridiflava]|uniref:multidrug effflux MFS transporter n=1 Tax=Pseudomonas viridiflava TaxID=33069 RepID=UPI0026469EFD|nr:multidrug effflux MFS transporter [Pseudomonas viridiflava]
MYSANQSFYREPSMNNVTDNDVNMAPTGKVIALLAGLSALSILSTNIILPAFPEMAAQLGVSSRELGLTFSSFFITFALAQLVVGPLADRYGRKKLVLGGLSVFVIGTAVCGFAQSFEMLIAGRVIQALGICAAAVLARAIARDLFQGEALARAMSLIMVATAAAPGFSPLLGSVLTTALGWRAIFVIVAIAALLVALIYSRTLGETLPASSRVSRTVPEVFVAYGKLMRDRRFILPGLSVSLLMSGLFASFGAAPAILMSGIGLTSLEAGFYFAATVFVVFTAGIAAPRLAHRFGIRTVTATGFAIALFGGLLLLLGPVNPSLGAYTLSMVIFLCGMGLANPLGTAITMGPYGAQAGLASALLGFLTMGCAAVTTWLGSALTFAAVTTLGGTQVMVCSVALGVFVLSGRVLKTGYGQ